MATIPASASASALTWTPTEPETPGAPVSIWRRSDDWGISQESDGFWLFASYGAIHGPFRSLAGAQDFAARETR